MARHLATLTREEAAKADDRSNRRQKTNSLFPAPIDPAQFLPLVLCLCGKSQTGSDAQIQVRVLVPSRDNFIDCPRLSRNAPQLRFPARVYQVTSESSLGHTGEVLQGRPRSSFFRCPERLPGSSLVPEQVFSVAVMTSFYQRAGVFH